MKQVLNRHTGSEEGRYCFVWTADAAAASTARYALDKFSLLNGFLLQVLPHALELECSQSCCCCRTPPSRHTGMLTEVFCFDVCVYSTS